MKKRVFIIFIMIFAITAIMIFLYLFSVKKNNDRIEELRPDDITYDTDSTEQGGLRYYIIDGVYVQAGMKDLYMQNPDVRGWIMIPNTKVDYPVLQSGEDDPEFYLSHNFDKKTYLGGSIFADASADTVFPSSNVILYGHHMADGSQFRQIMKYEDAEFYEKNKTFWYKTLEGNAKYEVIAAFRTSTHDGDFKFWECIDMDKEEFDTYISQCKLRTRYATRETAEYGDKLLSLCTCAYHTLNGKFIVVAKRVSYQEIDKTKPPIDVINNN